MYFFINFFAHWGGEARLKKLKTKQKIKLIMNFLRFLNQTKTLRYKIWHNQVLYSISNFHPILMGKVFFIAPIISSSFSQNGFVHITHTKVEDCPVITFSKKGDDGNTSVFSNIVIKKIFINIYHLKAEQRFLRKNMNNYYIEETNLIINIVIKEIFETDKDFLNIFSFIVPHKTFGEEYSISLAFPKIIFLETPSNSHFESLEDVALKVNAFRKIVVFFESLNKTDELNERIAFLATFFITFGLNFTNERTHRIGRDTLRSYYDSYVFAAIYDHFSGLDQKNGLEVEKKRKRLFKKFYNFFEQNLFYMLQSYNMGFNSSHLNDNDTLNYFSRTDLNDPSSGYLGLFHNPSFRKKYIFFVSTLDTQSKNN